MLPRLKAASSLMNKVDRLDWAVGFSLKSYGVRIGIRSNDPAALVSARRHLPSDWEVLSSPLVDRIYSILIGSKGSRANGRRSNQLYGDDVRLARSFDLDELYERLESDLRLFVAELARHRVFVHAGVVGWKGQAIVIPGRSYSGKSTLVAELVRSGATYYSDEYAVLDSRGRVHPYARPLGMRSPGSDRAQKVKAEDIGATIGSKPLRVGLVLSTKFKAGARWRPREITHGKGVLELMSNTVAARSQPERALTVLPAALRSARILKGVRGEAGEIVEAILSTDYAD